MSSLIEPIPAQNKCIASAWMTAEELIEKKILKPGDLIEFHRKYLLVTYYHWAIMEDDNDAIIHFTGEPTDKSGAKITRGSLKETAGDSKIRINNFRDVEHEKAYTSLDGCEKMLDRARSRIGKYSYVDGKHVRYNVLTNNCEHFATFCRYGIPSIGQSKKVHQLIGRNHFQSVLLPPNARKWVNDLNILPFKEIKVEKIVNDEINFKQFMNFLDSKNEEEKIFALQLFNYISEYGNCNNNLVENGMVKKLLNLTKDASDEIVQYALCVIVDIAENENHKQAVIDAKFIPEIMKLLNSTNTVTIRVCVMILANLSLGTKEQVEAITVTVPSLMKHLHLSEKVCEFVIDVFVNIASNELLDEQLIEHLKDIDFCKCLEYRDMTVQKLVLGLILNITEKSMIFNFDQKLKQKIIDLQHSSEHQTILFASLVLLNFEFLDVTAEEGGNCSITKEEKQVDIVVLAMDNLRNLFSFSDDEIRNFILYAIARMNWIK